MTPTRTPIPGDIIEFEEGYGVVVRSDGALLFKKVCDIPYGYAVSTGPIPEDARHVKGFSSTKDTNLTFALGAISVMASLARA